MITHETRMRALKAVAMADGTLHELERRMLSAVQDLVTHTSFDLDALEPLHVAELSAAGSLDERAQLLDQCVILALIDGDVSPREAALLEEYAIALGVRPASVADVARLVDRQLNGFRFDVLRRSFFGQRAQEHARKHGLRGIAAMARGLRGWPHAATASRYHALERLPEGTLGRAYFDFTRTNGFAFPGERNGPPEPMVFHDCIHVLAEYGTSAEEETQIASFQSGVLRRGSVFGLMFVLAQFQLGLRMSPVVPEERLLVDPELFLKAYLRGKNVTRDLCTDWEPWDDFEVPLEELRTRYAIAPR